MKGQKRFQVEVHQGIAINDDGALSFKKRFSMLHAPRRTQNFILQGIMHPQIRRAGGFERFPDGFRQVMEIDHHLPNARSGQLFQGMDDQGLIEDRHHSFGAKSRQRPEPRPEPGAEQHGFH